MAYEKENSATRLLELVRIAATLDRKLACGKVWAMLFKVEDSIGSHEVQRVTSDFLSAVGGELNAIEAAMQSLGVPDELFKPCVSQFRKGFSVGALSTAWSAHYEAHFRPETILAMRWIAHVLPSDALVAEADELTELRETLEALESLISAEGVPRPLAELVRRQLGSIKSALALTPLQGVAALRKAARSIDVDLRVDADEIRAATQQGNPEAVSKVGEKFREAWSKTASIAGDLDKFSKAGKLALDLFEVAKPVLGFGPPG